MKKILILALLSILSGCMTTDLTSKGMPFERVDEVPEGKAVAYFYTQDTRGGNACWLMGIDSVRGQCLGFPGYAFAIIDPGTRKISTTPNSPIKIANAKFEFDFHKNKAYYFQYEELPSNAEKSEYVFTLYNVAYGTDFGWRLVDEKDAMPALSKLNSW